MTQTSGTSATACTLAHVPYLNSAPFFQGLSLGTRWQAASMPPRQFGQAAEQGTVDAGPMSLMDFLRLQNRFERVGHLGIAVRGRSGSALLFSRVPVRQLDGAVITVSEETSTTVMLLRLILEQRYHLAPAAYRRAASAAPTVEPAAVLLIGDEALRFRANNRTHPFEIDLSFEWWLWKHLPFVFAVWAVRTGCDAEAKEQLSRALFRALAVNSGRLAELAGERAGAVGLSADVLTAYLEQFVYRLSEPEERGIQHFTELVHAHDLH